MRHKQIKEILRAILIVGVIISFFVITSLYGDGHFQGTAMERILPPLLWCLFVAFEVMTIFTYLTDSLLAMWVFGILAAVISFLLGFFHLSTVVIITVAVLAVIILILNFLKSKE